MPNRFLALAAPALLTFATAAHADGNNNPPPANPVFSLTGLPQSESYVNYTFSFVAQDTLTNLTFAMRNDPQYIQLDDVSLRTAGGPELLVNGGFEDGPALAHAPSGWTYVNEYGATAAGIVRSECAHTGSYCYYDGAVQAYDAITQAVATTVGTTYDVSFWTSVSQIDGTGLYQPLSTNGGSSNGGNGIDLFVYAGRGAPVATAAVPEPASWAMMIGGFGLAGAALRRRPTRAIAVA